MGSSDTDTVIGRSIGIVDVLCDSSREVRRVPQLRLDIAEFAVLQSHAMVPSGGVKDVAGYGIQLEVPIVLMSMQYGRRARPFVSQSNCFVVPPLKFATDALECLRVAV